MAKAKRKEDKRLKVKSLIEQGSISTFEDIVIIMGPSAIAKLFSSNSDIIRGRVKKAGLFRLAEIHTLADFFEVSPNTMFQIVSNQYLLIKKPKK